MKYVSRILEKFMEIAGFPEAEKVTGIFRQGNLTDDFLKLLLNNFYSLVPCGSFKFQQINATLEVKFGPPGD